MWTNVFRIAGLQQVSWFQFLPLELDGSTLSDKSNVSIEDQRDAATLLVLSAHVRLQNDGFLSTWTNSFVGPWDPSQGIHNPDEKIKLWLFLPGRVSTISGNAQAAVQGLKVVASGVWCAPGNSEEVAIALSQALRNRIERSFRGLAYMRYGDVFVKHRSFGQGDRRPLFACEFVFSASEEGIFVHVICSSKRVRPLSNNDIEGVLRKQSQNQWTGEYPSVFVAPNGMRGKLTGCCPGDLASRLYQSKLKRANELVVASLPFHLTYTYNGNVRGQTYYAEVSLGCLAGRTGNVEHVKVDNVISKKEGLTKKAERMQESENYVQLVERTFIYPAEAVLVPMMPSVPARTCLRRCWLRDWAGTSWLERGSMAETSSSYFSTQGAAMGTTDGKDSLDSSRIGSNGLPKQNSNVSDSSSSSSSSSSRGSASSSESDAEHGNITGDIDADADSLISKQSQLTSAKQLDTNVSKSIPTGKRGHLNGAESASEVASAKKMRTGENTGNDLSGVMLERPMCDTGISGTTLKESGNAAVSSGAVLTREIWPWPDDDQTIGIDAFDEFGDFGDFFEDDPMLLGEPPGSAETQAFIMSMANGGDVMGGPDSRGLDPTDQMLGPIFDFPCLVGFDQPECSKVDIGGNKDSYKDSRSSQGGSQSSGPSTGEVDSLPKAESMFIFAPEYTPVGKPKSEMGSAVFKNPYIPATRRLQRIKSNLKQYIYSATPPPSPSKEVCEFSNKLRNDVSAKDKRETHIDLKSYYTQTMPTTQLKENFLNSSPNNSVMQKAAVPLSKMGITIQSKKSENGFGTGGFLMLPRTVLATEVECAMLQAAMCRIRHMLLKSTNILRFGSNKLAIEPLLSQTPSTPQCPSTNMSLMKTSRNELNKKENIPVRITGDVDEEMHDGTLTGQVGVWKPVGAPRPPKAIHGNESSRNHSYVKSEDETTFPHTHRQTGTLTSDTIISPSYVKHEEDSTLTNVQKQQLYELLDAMPMLVQQATSFTDIVLDGECGDGAFGWLAFDEQQRRKFSCGPATIHAGCGGTLAACHSLDASGVELIDPLSVDVTPAAVVNLLYSDVRMALKSAFGDTSSDGPLLITEWCKGRVHFGDRSTLVESYSSDCGPNDSKESSSTVTVGMGEPITPPQSSAVCSVNFKQPNIQQIDSQLCEVRGNKNWNVESLAASESVRMDDTSQRRNVQELETESRNKPTLLALPVPSLLVGYQDDWLKTSSATLQLWEKAPFEPYARPKPVSYYIVCPNIDTLVSASVDFLLQLSTVYEACKLGTHASLNTGGLANLNSGKWASAGVVPVECPQQLQKTAQNLSFVASVNDYLLALEKGWDVTVFRKSLSEALKMIPVSINSSLHQKENEGSACLVIYVICPFAEPTAVLQTVMESCSCIGASVSLSDEEKRLLSYSQIERAQDLSSASDETVILSIPTLFGYSVPKLVLQVLTSEMILNVSRPSISESIALKEIAFSVYNKARRISRVTTPSEALNGASQLVKSRTGNMHMGSTVTRLWKDCTMNTTNTGATSLPRESLLDAGCLRSNAWENSWQTARQGESMPCDTSGVMEYTLQDDVRYLFEPLFILAEPGSLDQGVSFAMSNSYNPESVRAIPDEAAGNTQSSGSLGQGEIGPTGATEGSEPENAGTRLQKFPSLHCCYGWTEDWQWLVCVWTDARGELLDVHIFPFGGISGRQDTKGLERIFIQVLQQGLQLISLNPDMNVGKPRSIVIARIGCFYELECQEWQKAIIAVGGHEVKKWPVQLRRFASDGNSSSATGSALQQQEMSLIQDRGLPSSPSPSSSIYNSHSKTSSFIKAPLVHTNTRKQPMSGNASDVPKGVFQWIQSISLVALCLDHTLQLVCPSDPFSQGATQGSSMGLSNVIEGLSSVKTLSSTTVSNLLVPSHGLRFLPPLPLQLPICLTAESPPLAHLLHSKGHAFPFASSFAVSKATPSIRRDPMQQNVGEEWPSTLMINLVDYYGSTMTVPTSQQSGIASESISKSKHMRTPGLDGKDFQVECHHILECVASEINALSWLSVSPAFQDRRTALPIHCDMVQRLRRLIYFAGKEFGVPGSQGKYLPS